MSLYLYIFLLYLYRKTEEKETKKNLTTLPSAYAKTLDKVALPAALPSAKILALGKNLKVC